MTAARLDLGGNCFVNTISATFEDKNKLYSFHLSHLSVKNILAALVAAFLKQ